MKWIFSALLVAVLFVCLVTPTFAETPDYHFGMVQCSGLSLSELTAANQKFDTLYGWQHNFPSGDTAAGTFVWKATYRARVNGFAATVGCPEVLNGNDRLNLFYKINDPWYMFYLANGAIP